MTADTPPVLYISISCDGLTVRYNATPQMQMGADPWYPEDEVKRLRELIRRAYHALDPDRNKGPVSEQLVRQLRRKLAAEVEKHFPGEIRRG